MWEENPSPLANLLLLPPSAFNWNQFKGGCHCSFWFQQITFLGTLSVYENVTSGWIRWIWSWSPRCWGRPERFPQHGRSGLQPQPFSLLFTFLFITFFAIFLIFVIISYSLLFCIILSSPAGCALWWSQHWSSKCRSDDSEELKTLLGLIGLVFCLCLFFVVIFVFWEIKAALGIKLVKRSPPPHQTRTPCRTSPWTPRRTRSSRGGPRWTPPSTTTSTSKPSSCSSPAITDWLQKCYLLGFLYIQVSPRPRRPGKICQSTHFVWNVHWSTYDARFVLLCSALKIFRWHQSVAWPVSIFLFAHHVRGRFLCFKLCVVGIS